ncbi:opioid-binding protein/cell adhesion molecule homolog [Haliotis asinina]|uniref:opioid-binding protein/cell adhesion molecule homolog n=1 Tax=Haliotis asinina TaxID=109174 RepID=UPI0035321FB4
MSRYQHASVFYFLLWVLHVDGASFLNKPSNLTIKRGSNAIFPCKVENLETSDRVAWFSITSSKLLSMDGHTFSSDNHVIVNIHPIGGFQLQINNVTVRDGGMYKCMVTTDPVMEQTSILRVIDNKTTGKRRVPRTKLSRKASDDQVSLKNRPTIRTRT